MFGFGMVFLKEHLPTKPSHFLLFQILFGTPHILASTLVLVGSMAYIKRYQRQLILMTVGIIVFFWSWEFIYSLSRILYFGGRMDSLSRS